MPTRMGSRSCPAMKSDKTRHSKYVGIVNRLLSGLRSGALKSIELSRGLGTAEGYGNCKVRAGLAPFKLLVTSSLKI